MRTLIIIISSLFFITTSYAAQISVGDGLKLTVIDAQLTEGGHHHGYIFAVDEGRRQVVISYAKRLQKTGKGIMDMGLVSSNPVIFSVDVKGDTHISVKRFNSMAEAEGAIRRGLTFTVKNALGTVQIKDPDKLKGNGSNPFGPKNIIPLVKAYNRAHGITLPMGK